MRRCTDLSKSWPADGSTTRIPSPIIRSVRTITGVRCCAVSARPALERELLSAPQFDDLRPDLEITLPGLRACRQLLVAIPASLEEQPRVADLLRDEQVLGRLRRVHTAFGEALREERLSRESDALDQ